MSIFEELKELGYLTIVTIQEYPGTGKSTYLASDSTSDRQVIIKTFSFSNGGNWEKLKDFD